MSTPKLALCVNLSALVNLGLDTSIPRSLQAVDINMVAPEDFMVHDRAYVDALDMVLPASATPQLIGYGVIKVVGQGNRPRYVCYQRPVAGGESRLHGSFSLGFGGHIEPEDEASSPIATVKASLQRELYEECGLAVDPHDIVFEKLIVDTTNDVGKVHIGLPAIIEIDPTRLDTMIQTSETGKLYLFTLETLKRGIADFENWSQLVIEELL